MEFDLAGARPASPLGSWVTFHDLRGTAVTRLVAGCTEAEIATLTAHSLRDVRAILDSHDLNRDPALAESAIRKLEGGKNAQLSVDVPMIKREKPSEINWLGN